MLKTSTIAIVLTLAGTSAGLAQRASSTAMTCQEASAYVRQQGSVVLGTGGMTYDRFVSDGRFCPPNAYLKTAVAPTRDMAQCIVGYTCAERFTTGPDSVR